ncbi:MAG: DUF6062 family protein [Eubacteriales bacterium]|nr:DUF6062 family protein [Eubacteriales bacterium]
MKEKIYTIPLTDAFQAGDECPFCFIERELERHTMDFVLGPGASYMEDDVRAQTDAVGFCRTHFKKMYEYGNRLGAGLILKTHVQKKNQELHDQIKMFSPGRASLLDRLKKPKGGQEAKTSIGQWAKEQEDSCYICSFYEDSCHRYMETFFDQYKKDGEFRELFKKSRGFCIPHFGDLTEAAARLLSEREQKDFFSVLFPLMEENMERMYQELDWFCDKFDYRNKDADWKTSKDALPRGMQKAAGGYPGDEPYTADR